MLAIKAILHIGQKRANEYNQVHADVDVRQPNPYLVFLDAGNGAEQIEQLQNHESETVSACATEIAQLYLQHGDDD
jgi:hypothetical protein